MRSSKAQRVSRSISVMIALVLMLTALAGCAKPAETPAAATPAATAAAPAATEAAPSDVPPVKIAAFYNLSGASADAGALSVQGIELALKHINDAGGIKSLGGAKLEAVFYDTMSDPSQAKAVADRAVADPDIMAAIGIGGSAYGVPMLPTFEKNSVAFFHNGTADSFTNQGYTTVFRFANDGVMFGAQQVNFLNYLNDALKLGITKVGACYENAEHGISNAKGAKAAAEKAGLEWVYDESFQTGLTDASNIIVNMKKSGVQVVFMTAFSQDCKVLVNTMKSLNYSPIIIGSGAGFLFPAFRDELGEDVNGILSVISAPWDSKIVRDVDGLKDVAAEYEATYGVYMAEHAVGAYTAVQLAAASIEGAAARDRAAICKAAREVHIDTYSGKIDFAENGQNQSVIVGVIQWQKDPDGKYRPRCVFPDELAAVDFQVTDQMKAMLEASK